ncbi:MAG: hypothetical protein WCP85_00580 [Mariniphaga sp.]
MEIHRNISNTQIYKQLALITIFSVAMGMLESSVVVYLRELYYPGGFQFPIRATSYTVAVTELMRELATLIMLLTIGMVAGKTKQERFAWFIYSFAIWDIFYYAFLYLIIGWPMSLMDWDILFLLPMMWTGPVWAPLLLSILMIILAICILVFSDLHQNSHLKLQEWALLISGSVVVIIAFCKDFYISMTTLYPSIPAINLFFSKQTGEYAANYVPKSFDVTVFTFGTFLIIAGIWMYVLRNRKELKLNILSLAILP